jgi:MFS family permease
VPPTWSEAALDFLVPKGNARSVTFAGIFLTSGTSLWWPLFAIFLASNGLGPVLIGVVIALGTLVALLAAPVGGILADRYSRTGILVAAAAINAAGLFGIALAPSGAPAAFPILAAMFGVASFGGNLGGGAMRALLFESARKDQRGRAMASPYVLPSFVAIPMPFLGALMSQVVNWPFVFLVAGALVAVTSVAYALLLVEPKRDPLPSADAGARPRPSWFRRWGFLTPVLGIVGVYVLVGFGNGIVSPFMPIYFTVFLHSSVPFFGVLASIEMATVGILALVSGRLVDRWGSARTIFASFAGEAVAVVAMIFVRNLLLAGTLFVVWGAVDWLDLPAPSVYIGARVAQRNRATALSTFGVATQLPLLLAPAVGGALFAISPPLILVSYAAIVGVSTLAVVFLGGLRGEKEGIAEESPHGSADSPHPAH